MPHHPVSQSGLAISWDAVNQCLWYAKTPNWVQFHGFCYCQPLVWVWAPILPSGEQTFPYPPKGPAGDPPTQKFQPPPPPPRVETKSPETTQNP